MTGKVIRPKPGVYRGIEMRSQLEIAWAKYCDLVGAKWKYADEPYFDFFINEWPLEVKPCVASLVWDAVKRWWYHEAFGISDVPSDSYCWDESDCMCGNSANIICGSPPTKYGSPVLLFATLDRLGCVWFCVSELLSAVNDGKTLTFGQRTFDWESLKHSDRVLEIISRLVGEDQ